MKINSNKIIPPSEYRRRSKAKKKKEAEKKRKQRQRDLRKMATL